MGSVAEKFTEEEVPTRRRYMLDQSAEGLAARIDRAAAGAIDALTLTPAQVDMESALLDLIAIRQWASMIMGVR
jgi:hypothetical protein